MKTYYVYILARKKWHSIIGVTNDLLKRVYEHKNNLVEGNELGKSNSLRKIILNG